MDNNLLWELALILMGATGGGMLGFLLGVLLMCMMSVASDADAHIDYMERKR